jgi:homoserine dehydrogenase
MSKKINIALLGFGTAGQGFYEVTEALGSESYAIRGVAVKDKGKKRKENIPFTFEAEKLIADPLVHVVVEATGDVDATLQWYRLANALGKPFITANKQFVSRYPQLTDGLLYEASCGGALPTIRFGESAFFQGVQSVQAILNGSTNYILSSVFSENATFKDALSRAKAAGFVEPDERLDLNGYDPAAKLAILCRHLFGLRVRPSQVEVIPLTSFSEIDVDFIRRRKLSIRYLATAVKTNKGIRLRVVPEILPENNLFNLVQFEENALLVTDKAGEEYFVKAKGAGRVPTGVALFNDLEAWRKGVCYRNNERLEVVAEHEICEAVVRSPSGVNTLLAGAETIAGWQESGWVYEHLRCSLNTLTALSEQEESIQALIVSNDLIGVRLKPDYLRFEHV